MSKRDSDRSSMKAYSAIDSDRKMQDFLRRLQVGNTELLAIDFEGESNLHEYGEKLCLVQVFDGAEYYAIDAFKVSRDRLAELFENKRIVKLFYGADSDLSLVFKQYGIRVKSVMDLKVFVDVLGLDKRGLGAVLSSVLGKTINDKDKYQMYNWTLRPIRAEAMEYALADVEHLIELRDELLKRIMAAGKYLELLSAFARSRNEFDGVSIPTIFKSNEYKNLKSREKECVKRIYDARDAIAKGLNFPPNVVLEKKYLFLLAKGEIAVKDIAFAAKISEKTKSDMKGSLEEILRAQGPNRALNRQEEPHGRTIEVLRKMQRDDQQGDDGDIEGVSAGPI
jgi:ribonuclease D